MSLMEKKIKFFFRGTEIQIMGKISNSRQQLKQYVMYYLLPS